MLTHNRWWLVVIVLIAGTSLAGIWLDGDVRAVVRGALSLASIVCSGAALFTWFRWSQRDEAVRSPIEPEAIAPEARREAAIGVGVAVLFVVLSTVLRVTFVDAIWFKLVASVVVIALWGSMAALHVRRVGRSGG